MNKYYLKNGKEVKVGDIITYDRKMFFPELGETFTRYSLVVTESILPRLIEEGIVTIKNIDIPTNINYYVSKIEEKLGLNKGKGGVLLNTISIQYPYIAFSMLLREVAIEIDKKYDNHIKDSTELYIISTLDGRIVNVPKAKIKNYRNFSAFRTLSDAKFACSILRDYLKEMYAKKRE